MDFYKIHIKTKKKAKRFVSKIGIGALSASMLLTMLFYAGIFQFARAATTIVHTSQSDFENGTVPVELDATSSPGELRLSHDSIVQTSDADFSKGATNGTEVIGSGNDASIGLGNISWTLGDNFESHGFTGIRSPGGMVLDETNNKLYYCDWSNGVIRKMDSGTGGTTLGENQETSDSIASPWYFTWPEDIAVDPLNNRLFVVDYYGFYFMDSGEGGTTFGANLTEYGTLGDSGPGTFNEPRSIAIDIVNNKLYVTDKWSGRGLMMFDSGGGGTTLGDNWVEFGTLGSGVNQFNRPTGISVDTVNNKVYIGDIDNSRIVMIDSGTGGTTLGANFSSFGTSGSGVNQFNGPYGTFVYPDNHKLLIADKSNNRIVIVDSGTGGTTFGANFTSYTNGTLVNSPEAIIYYSGNDTVFVNNGNNTLGLFNGGLRSGIISYGNYESEFIDIGEFQNSSISWDSDVSSETSVSLQTRVMNEVYTEDLNDGDTTNISDFYDWGGTYSLAENEGVLKADNASSSDIYLNFDTGSTYPAGSVITASVKLTSEETNAYTYMYTEDWGSDEDGTAITNEWTTLSFVATAPFSMIGFNPYNFDNVNPNDKFEVRWIHIGSSLSSWSSPYSNSAGSIIENTSNGDLIQYRAALSTSDTSTTPTLNSVIISSSTYLSYATYTSSVIDAISSVDWQTFSATTDIPMDTSLAFQTRAGNIAIPDDSWSSWENLSENTIASPDARYLQYKAIFTAVDTSATPILKDVSVMYDAYEYAEIGGELTLVKDVLPGSEGSFPYYLTDLNGELFFVGNDGVCTSFEPEGPCEGGKLGGLELWKSDGTENGTRMVKNINLDDDAGITFIVESGGVVYFRANDGINGYELWKSDGTESGTVMVKDINSTGEGNGSYPENITSVDGIIYFSADDGVNGTELWKSDGTESGTQLVKDINPEGDSQPFYFVEFEGFLYFSADDGENGAELWKSDGTENGTLILMDINPVGNSYPGDFIEFNGSLYFSADDGENGRELWKSDGALENTRMIYDLNPNGGSGFQGDLVDGGGPVISGNSLFFVGNDGFYGSELWKADGAVEIKEPQINAPPAPQIKEIKEISKDSVKFEIQVDLAYAGQELDFEIKIKNKDKNDTENEEQSKIADENGRLVLTIDDLKPDTDYSISVRFSLKNEENFSDYSEAEKLKTARDIEDDDKCVINNIKAKKEADKVLLSWDKACKEINGILIERKIGSGPYKQIDSIGRKKTSYEDIDIEGYGTYTYRARGFKGDKYTGYSEEVSVYFQNDYANSNNETLSGEDGFEDNTGIAEGGIDHFDNDDETDDSEKNSFQQVGDNKNKSNSFADSIFGGVKNFTREFSKELTILVFTGIAAGIAVAGSSASIPLLASTPYPFQGGMFRLFSIIGIISRKKKEFQEWGVVFDAQTRQPIIGAVVSLIGQNGHVVDTAVSDSQGRYGFLPNSGIYNIQISRKDYVLDNTHGNDLLYGDTYAGGPVSIAQNQVEKINIALKNEKVDWRDFAKRKLDSLDSSLSIIKRDFFLVLFYAGAVVTVGISYMFPSSLNTVLLFMYAGIIAFRLFSRRKSFGVIKRHDDAKPVPFAMVSVYASEDMKQRKTFAVSDVFGRYYLLVENGNYLAKIAGNFLDGKHFEKIMRVNVDNGMINSDVEV